MLLCAVLDDHVTDNPTAGDIREKADNGNMCIVNDQIPLKTRCRSCSFTCNNDSQLALHMKTGHESTSIKHGNFKCPECTMNTAKKEVLIWHLSHHTGDHSIMYYACSGCDAEKQLAGDIQSHINKKHSTGAYTVGRVETVHYLQNIMKCPVCRDGLVWKQIFIEHLHDKHNLSDLATHLDVNYGDKCPDKLEFPVHLMKSNAKRVSTEETDSSERLSVTRFHCDDCEFTTNDSDAYRQHQNSHSQTTRTRTESHSYQSEDGASSVEPAVSTDNIIYSNRTAKIKAYTKIIRSPLKMHRTKIGKWKLAKTKENKQPCINRTSSDRVEPVVLKKKAESQSAKGDFITEFEKKLPDSYVFAEDVKCPKCYFASRVRVNLLRHVKSHITDNNKSVTLAPGTHESDVHLSYNLWNNSLPVEKPTEEEPEGLGMSDSGETDTNANDASRISPNSPDMSDNVSNECQTAEEEGFSQSESSPTDFTEDGEESMSEQSAMLSCETCLNQFSSDVDLERHISKSHGGPYICHLCGVLMWQQNAVREHHSSMHPGSPLVFELLRKRAADSPREVGGSGVSERKIARVQGTDIYSNSLILSVTYEKTVNVVR